MKNNETGEFELVLGNKQLLSGFFIVVILFAVFFVMGYIVGRNSTPMAQTAAVRDQTSAPVAARPQPPAPAVAQNSPPGEAPKEESSANQNPPADATPQAPPVEVKTQPPATAASAPATPAPAASAPAEAAPGEIYLQVTAVKEDVAQTVANTLKGKGFPASVAPGPPGKMRVLVGPYTDRGKLGEAKAELERLGFAPFVKK